MRHGRRTTSDGRGAYGRWQADRKRGCAVIDLHTHLLPGVDDGSPTVEVSVGVLAKFADDGVEMVVCTPHWRASRAAEAPHAEYERILETLTAALPGRPRLRRGWEIMLDIPGVDLTAPMLSLGESTAVLVEFPRTGVPARAGEELLRLRASGVVPVLAHPERYWGCTLTHLQSWRQGGTVVQVDAAALLAGGRMGQLAFDFLEHGLVDCLSSDNHGDHRSLKAVRDWLVEQGAAEHASLLMEVNPRRLLDNLPTLPVPGVRVGRGVMARLRELVRGRRHA